MTLANYRDVLIAVLDTLIPPSGTFPGAGVVAIDHVLTVAAASKDVDARLSRVLERITEEAPAAPSGTRADFAALNADQREVVLQRVEESHPELFDALVRHTYDGYYSHPTVIALLGLDPGPPHPHGHPVEAVDGPDLGRVSGRGPLYRRA